MYHCNEFAGYEILLICGQHPTGFWLSSLPLWPNSHSSRTRANLKSHEQPGSETRPAGTHVKSPIYLTAMFPEVLVSLYVPLALENPVVHVGSAQFIRDKSACFTAGQGEVKGCPSGARMGALSRTSRSGAETTIHGRSTRSNPTWNRRILTGRHLPSSALMLWFIRHESGRIAFAAAAAAAVASCCAYMQCTVSSPRFAVLALAASAAAAVHVDQRLGACQWRHICAGSAARESVFSGRRRQEGENPPTPLSAASSPSHHA